MNNSLLPIRDFVLSQYEVNSAQLQHDYGLTYIETKNIIQRMLSNADIIYKSGLTYLVVPNNRQNKKVKISSDEQLMRALWVCICLDKVTARAIEINLKIEFSDALRLIEQMEKNGYISHSPERRVLLTADDFIYKFGRRPWMAEKVEEDVYIDDDGIICVGSGPDIKEKLAYSISMHIENSERGANEAYIYNHEGNIMFAIQEMPDYIQITDRGVVLEDCPLPRAKVNNILKKQNEFITINDGELTICVKNYDYVLHGILELYSAISAIDLVERKE